MDKRRSVLNVSVSILSRILLLISALYVRRLLIQYIGTDANGLNSLYSSVIGMLAVAELGVGSAIVYSMYRPIIKGNWQQVAALYRLHRRVYRIIGAVIFGAGVLAMPFLPAIIGDYEALSVNVYGTFFLTLLSVALSYLYSAKTSLIEAYKDNYITTGIMTGSRLLRYALQIAAILIWKSYTAYLVCQIFETLVIWSLTELVVRRKHGDILRTQGALDREVRYEVVRNIKAMFMHKVGTILVNSVDSMIISGFIGLAVLGKYSNYTLLAGVVAGTIGLFFSPLTAVVGHLCATGTPKQMEAYFNRFYCLNYLLGFVFFLGFYAVADPLVALCFGGEQVTSRAIAFIVTLNQFTSFMRRTDLLFRDASGSFYADRWKPVAEGVVNLLLSLLFVSVFPEEYRVVGVTVATIITTLTICDTVEPYIVFHRVFGKSPGRFYVRGYSYIALFFVCLLAMTWVVRPGGSQIVGVLRNGALSVFVSALALGLLTALDKGFRRELLGLIRSGRYLLRRVLGLKAHG